MKICKFVPSNKRNMEPIDKFLWKDNYDLEIAMLEYVDIMESIQLPEYDGDMQNPDFRIQVAPPGSNVEEEIFVPLALATRIFADRYNNRTATRTMKYEEYRKNETIQRFIKDLGLSVNKFWFLLLFAFDYSQSICLEGRELADSPNEQLINFINKLAPHISDIDLATGATMLNPVELRISVKGEKDLVIDNATSLSFIVTACDEKLACGDALSNKMMNRRRVKGNVFTMKDSPFIYYFSKMLLNFFDTMPDIVNARRKGAKHSRKEIDLVCQLIYFSKISRQKCWLDTWNETLKAFLKQYKGLEVKAVSSVYPPFSL